jgi:hypothetical protein
MTQKESHRSTQGTRDSIHRRTLLVASANNVVAKRQGQSLFDFLRAELYAGDFQLAIAKFRPLVSLLPSCDAMLSIRGISVTSNYRKQLIRAYVEPEYIQYLQYRFEWPNETIEMI